jgi:integrase
MRGDISMQVQKLTQAVVDKATAEEGAERSIYWDKAMSGFGLVVTSSGHKSFVCQYRAAGGRSRRLTIGSASVLDAEKARKQAKGILGRVATGGDPLGERRKAKAAVANSFRSVCERYLEAERKKDGKWKLRSLDERHAMLERLVYPQLSDRPISDVKRSDIVRLLDKVEERAQVRGRDGRVMADRVLATVRRIMNWHASRDDEFRSPIVRGMARTRPAEHARERTLTDDELRAVWRAADEATGPFGPFVLFLLLTGARRSEAAAMTRGELVGEDWTLPAARNKTKVDLVRPLSGAALAVLAKLPAIGEGELIFTTDGERRFSTFGRAKAALDKACGVTGWTLHDLRRTARSLMSRCGVPDRHAEECLGHVVGGVKGTYDRHKYHDEKKRAYEALAAQIARIVDPQQNVIQLTGR